ncbi:MAG TPA: radical SAM protein, partial [bacterium]|nr:radical SAM protein [bacterium]
GIRFMRELLGDPVDAPIRQDFDPCPLRILGVRYYFNNIISALGCRGACEFCATSAFFHYRKVRLISPAELWSIMKRRLTERRYGFIWIFDEDFFDDPDYVRELARLIDREKTLTLDRIHWGAFASVRALSAFTIDELVRMGVQSLWIGIESKFTHLPKRQGRDIVELFDALHAAGITTVGSFIVGWDHHTPENLDEDIAHVVRLNPTFSQISSLMPCPGTRLWKKLEAEKRLRTEGFRWKGFHLYAAMHDHLRLTDQEVFRGVRKTQRLLYEINGPSVLRSFEVYLQGYRWCKNHQDPRIRERTAYHERWCRESRPVLTAVRLFLPTPAVREKVERLRREYLREFGPLGFSSRVKSYLLVLACLVGLVFRKLPRPPKQPPYKRKVYPGIKSFPKPAAAVAGKELEKQAAAPETEKTEPLPVIPGKPAC